MTTWPERAEDIAETVLFPAADAVDADGEIPAGHFEVLAAEGFYGLAASGTEGPTFAELGEMVETLCGACLATSFTWMQHHGVVTTLSGSENTSLREAYLPGLIDGSIKGGVAFAGAIPRPPKLYARRTAHGYVFDGSAPFVTGWGIVDVVQFSARDEFDDTIVHAIVPATAGAGLSAEPISLIAADASRTARLQFDAVEIAAGSVAGVATDEQFRAGQLHGSWVNGCMAMGLVRRSIALLAEIGVDAVGLREEHRRARIDFDAALAGRFEMHRARAQASELAVRAAASLVTATGSGALTARGTAERLMREATFTLVAAGRPEIKSALFDVLGI